MAESTAKGFASTTDLAEKTITFSEIGTDLYAFTAEGDPNTAVIVGDDGCLVFDAQAKTGSVEITIDMKSVDTGSTEFDGHLQGADPPFHHRRPGARQQRVIEAGGLSFDPATQTALSRADDRIDPPRVAALRNVAAPRRAGCPAPRDRGFALYL